MEIRPMRGRLLKPGKTTRLLILMLAFVIGLGVMNPRPAHALICPDACNCEWSHHGILQANMIAQHALTTAWIALQFSLHRTIFWGTWMWNYNIGNALMQWTNELSSAAMLQMFSVGAFFDAKHQLETQALLQTKMVDAHRNYQPDLGMCTFGTVARSLGENSRRGELAAYALVENQIDRLTNARNSSGLSGPSIDRTARFAQVRRRFCDERDGSRQMASFVCNPATGAPGRNADIDYGRMVVDPLTINVDLTDATRTPEEEDFLALANNLYAHNLPSPFPNHLLNSVKGRTYLLNMRSIAAKHSVAGYSFASIVGMKTAGSAAAAGNAQYLRNVFETLGVPTTEATQMVGPRPSYYAQMELLTKKIYQQPQFYTDLYTSPANVERKSATIRALRMVQDMDKFNSVLRAEQNLSVLVEMFVDDIQKDHINVSGAVKE
ncbi:MAG: hypothetical protein HYS17_01250 [Micavibrio aeruginosavorus]|uniref:Uncharacterized protein n=1 Tax=Micavibrio aeruginosavorus TaxID=349221 RepID=A0A7T5R2T7_9BACT|nr:MAG: hypothetical protein HYS17_01250 [Micavibrio aeruginosavorus]